MDQTMTREADLVAELNDMLQLDHDAVHAYTLAASLLGSETHRNTLESYRADHERHIRELTQLIRDHGGIPIQLPHPTGPFKLAVQAAGKMGGDRGVLLAFKANERQVRDKYRRVANAQHPEDVALVLQRAARDEETHYAWALEALEDLGVSQSSTVGRMEAAMEIPHARMADMVEGAGKGVMKVAERARRSVGGRKAAAGAGLAAVLVAAGVGLLVSGLGRRR
jgi:rubrerythrin